LISAKCEIIAAFTAHLSHHALPVRTISSLLRVMSVPVLAEVAQPQENSSLSRRANRCEQGLLPIHPK
jgi:hypothetical protein